MIWLYRLLFLPGLLIVFPYYLKRMIKRGGYANGFFHRFGFVPKLPDKSKKRIWLHAVSVGELLAIEKLLSHLAKSSNCELVLTTTTSTGLAVAKSKYSAQALFIGLFPIDFYFFSRKAWKRIQPDLAILMEGELWPEHLRNAQKRKVPLVLLNGRLSERSFSRYQQIPMAKSIFIRPFSLILTGSPDEQKRYLQLGADPETVLVTGNIKFDNPANPLTDLNEKRSFLEASFNLPKDAPTPLILLGSSTWPGEENLLINVLDKAQKRGVDCRLLLVPRHAERRNEIIQQLKKQSLSWNQRSRLEISKEPVAIHLADTTGELKELSRYADIAFIGKSLHPNRGGQTPIDSASLGTPIVYGPNMNNFRSVCQSLEQGHASIRTNSIVEATEKLLELLQDENKRKQLSQAVTEWHRINGGATERSLEAINQYLSEGS